MDPQKDVSREIMEMERLFAALDRIPLNPPPIWECPEEFDPNFYCITCDSSYCTCIKEKP